MMHPRELLRLIGSVSLAALTCAIAARAQAPSPVFEWESVLDTFCNGATATVRFGDHVVVHAPAAPFRGEASVVDANGKAVAGFAFFEDYQAQSAAFARVRIKGPAEVRLPGPGTYALVFSIAGQPATRLPFSLKAASGGADPYAGAQRAFVFEGPWPRYAHLTMKPLRDQAIPYLTLWTGGADLAGTARQDMFAVTLLRNGAAIARSKKSQGHIAAGHYRRAELPLFHPHEDRQSHAARAFTASDLLADGRHELVVTRQSDGAVLRKFAFTVAGGGITPLPRTQPAFAPRTEFITPRVTKKATNLFETAEAIWLEQR
ncbi:MAG: hypothetical protein JNL39_22030 [Opitutaceae bacterium]|nr:hypothetical protein [Opitutaceae bacterium]